MHLVPQVARLGSHICIDPLEQLEKLILPPNGKLETVDKCDGHSHLIEI
jgi:hypothetical protein